MIKRFSSKRTMKNVYSLLACVILLSAIALDQTSSLAGRMHLSYPRAVRSPADAVYSGHLVPNPYVELEHVHAPSTLQWVDAEDDITRSVLSSIPNDASMRMRTMRIMTAPHDDLPQVGAHASVWQRTERHQRPVLMVRTASGVHVLLDAQRRWPSGKVALADWQLSPDGRLLAYATDIAGDGMVQWHVLSVEYGKDFNDVILGAPDWAPIAWSHDSAGFYYGGYHRSSPPPAGAPIGQGYFVRFHRLGQSQTEDQVVYSLPDHPSWLPYANESNDGRYLILGAISGAGGNGNLVAVRNLRSSRADISMIRPMTQSTWTYVDNKGPIAYFFTNDRAPLGRVVSIDLRNSATQHEVVPQSPATLEDVTAAGGQLIARYLRNAHSELRAFDRSGKLLHEIHLPGIGSVTVAGYANSPVAYYRFSSPTMPPVTFKYNVRSGVSTEVEHEAAPFDEKEYVTEEFFARSTDGVRVPVFVAHRRGITMNGTTPTIITGYGGFGDAYHPVWQTLSGLWLAQGGAFAIACVRGGGEYGEAWHRAGMLGEKQNAFDDFAAAARALIWRGYASSRTLAAYGYSGGGLLVGVTEVQHPNLFHAVAEEAGPVDVLRGYTYGSEAVWANEVGLPVASQAQFTWLYAYAPLVHIQKGTAYPATLVMTSENDARVSPAHAYKFAATLQWAQASRAPVLLYVATNRGHVGGNLASQVNTIADTAAFLWWQTKPPVVTKQKGD